MYRCFILIFIISLSRTYVDLLYVKNVPKFFTSITSLISLNNTVRQVLLFPPRCIDEKTKAQASLIVMGQTVRTSLKVAGKIPNKPTLWEV